MDFSITDDQRSLQELARRILTEQVTHGHLVALEATGWSVFDRELWRLLAEAGLTGIGVPEDAGGAGLGFLDVALVLEEVGRTVAPVPAVPTLVTSYVLARHAPTFATDLLAGVASGDTVLTTAFEAEVTARRDGDGWVLDGEAPFVPYGAEADAVLVPADGEHGPVLALVRRGTAAVTDLQTTNREPQALLTFAGTAVGSGDVLDEAATVVDALRQHTAAGLAVVAAGVCAAALEMTAKYTSNREQFGKPIASFQAVGQRAADAYIDTEMVRLTAWQAVWRLDAGRPAADEVAVAKFWAGDGGMRALHACQHLHGGIGVDLDYPLHRYFLWGKQLEHELGTPTRQLLTLGASLAANPV
ncbi:MAG TPA: acyl-CoA dehydrogenase family protein [Mycobacteriales bacterium]|jgi:alkylation response protein AidB-like acyl-CoA dehydrogenase|nr:acyl-CoA dehydrogenase family protein [Mycobacteriales bacterium]